MLVFLHPRVSFRVSGCPVASPCLWGKLGNLTFSNVSKQVVLSFCVAGVALCDIPTCLITCGKCQNWRKSRTKCSFFCTHVFRFESLVVLWRRRVYGGSWKTLPFCFQAGCHTLHTLHFTLLTPHSTLYTRHSFALFTPHSTLYTLHFPFYAPYFTLRTSHSTLSTPRSTLHTLHSTLYTLGWWSRDSCGASCHVLLTWLREISALLSFKILINMQRCRCPKRWIELVPRVY